LDSLHLLLDKVLLVLWKGHSHDVIVVLDVGKHGFDGVLAVVEDLLSLLQILKGSLEIESFLDLLHLLLSILKLDSDGFQALSIALPGSLGVLEQLKAGGCLILGFIPSLFNALDMSIQKLRFAVEKENIVIKIWMEA
jgi:hypothetical protein